MSHVEDKTGALFQLKADFFPITVVKISEPEIARIKEALIDTISKAPKYLHQAPIVIDLRAMPADLQNLLDIKQLYQIFRDNHVIPVGIRGADSSLHQAIQGCGMAVMTRRDVSIAEGHQTSPAPKKEAAPKAPGTAKVLNRPARSGTQVYARGTDLVALTAINPGAEVLADGNIHVYGPLRGRALAGANGNKNAHIFCQSLEAELISIAGVYLTKDNIKFPKIKKSMIHIFLKDDKIQIEGI